MMALHARDYQWLERYGVFTEWTKTKLKCMTVLAVGLQMMMTSLAMSWRLAALVKTPGGSAPTNIFYFSIPLLNSLSYSFLLFLTSDFC